MFSDQQQNQFPGHENPKAEKSKSLNEKRPVRKTGLKSVELMSSSLIISDDESQPSWQQPVPPTQRN